MWITAKEFYAGFDPATGQDFTLEEGESAEVSDEKIDQLKRDGLDDRFSISKTKPKGAGDDSESQSEPYEGYAEAKADERVAKIESGVLELEQLQAIKADQDAAKKPQKSVVAAVEAAIETAEGSND